MIFSHCVYLACGVCLSNSAQAWTTSHCILLFRKPVCCWISMWKVKCTFKNAKIDVQGKTYVHTHTHMYMYVYENDTSGILWDFTGGNRVLTYTNTVEIYKRVSKCMCQWRKILCEVSWLSFKMNNFKNGLFFSDQWELRSQFLICWLTVRWFKKCS